MEDKKRFHIDLMAAFAYESAWRIEGRKLSVISYNDPHKFYVRNDYGYSEVFDYGDVCYSDILYENHDEEGRGEGPYCFAWSFEFKDDESVRYFLNSIADMMEEDAKILREGYTNFGMFGV